MVRVLAAFIFLVHNALAVLIVPQSPSLFYTYPSSTYPLLQPISGAYQPFRSYQPYVPYQPYGTYQPFAAYQPFGGVYQPIVTGEPVDSTEAYELAEEYASDPKYSPFRKGGNNETEEGRIAAEENVAPVLYASRLGARNLDLCYYLGEDIFTSHVACNENWADGTSEGVRKYINELTFETNKMLGTNNLLLSWKGPFARHDSKERYPTNPSFDTTALFSKSCDAVIFLVFNQFSSDCTTAVDGHKYAGINKGGMCESQSGGGYTVVVDQGYIDDVWTGPQILAHHLLRMLIADLPEKDRSCPETTSLLHSQLYPGIQKVDQCVVEKLNKSKVSLRPCMNN